MIDEYYRAVLIVWEDWLTVEKTLCNFLQHISNVKPIRYSTYDSLHTYETYSLLPRLHKKPLLWETSHWYLKRYCPLADHKLFRPIRWVITYIGRLRPGYMTIITWRKVWLGGAEAVQNFTIATVARLICHRQVTCGSHIPIRTTGLPKPCHRITRWTLRATSACRNQRKRDSEPTF